MNIFNCNLFFPEIFSLSFGFLSCFFFPIPFSYLCFFLILSYVVCSTSMFLVSKNKVENTNFWSKGELQQNGFFYEPVFFFFKCEKLSFSLPIVFCQILIDVQKTL